MSNYKRLTKQAGWHKDIDLKDELGYSYIYQRLAELENKIEQGTLIELPCKGGDKFWCINKTKYGLPFVSDMTVEYFQIINGVVYMGNFNCFRIRAWQKSELFLTREEAENKLKELQDEHKSKI